MGKAPSEKEKIKDSISLCPVTMSFYFDGIPSIEILNTHSFNIHLKKM